VYLELEGAPGWIDRNARRLGFAESDYSTASYYGLYVGLLPRAWAAGHAHDVRYTV
jgi:hypothetical protein